ncbi:MAG: hypothetical protein IJC21_03885 [Lentisphaeria bacterium]|nr:hypothetical protein [Lentisphaeria bacterium]MBR7119006.1 hypothetical protein [Lentisphaeria bacterium]
MTETRNRFPAFCLMLLLIFTAVSSFAGANSETVANTLRLSEKKELQHTPESIEKSLPYTPSATYRFSNRQTRTAANTNRIRPWTPVDLKESLELINKNFPPSLRFELPDNVQATCTAHTLCTSPVRAGPEYIFLT